MTPNICIVAIDPQAEQLLRQAIAASSLTLWHAGSVEAYLADPRRERTMCLILDLPRGTAIAVLKALRAAEVDVPALILADADEALAARDLAAVCVLDVLRRPLKPRELLVWIECILLTLMALVRERLRCGLPERHAA